MLSPPMFLMESRDLLPVPPHADRGQHRDVRDLAIQPGLDHGAVQDQTNDILVGQAARTPRIPVDLHLCCPSAADDVLADGALEQPEQRPLDPARVGAGEIDRGDQGLGLLRQPLVTGQRLRPPLRYLASFILDPAARHPHRLRPKGAGQVPLAVPVAVPFHGTIAPVVAKSAEKTGQLLFDGRADVGPQPLLDRVEPGLSGQLNRLDSFLSCVVGCAVPNTEALDGFLAALACCPDPIMPSEFLQVLQTGTTDPGAVVFDDTAEEHTSGLVFDDTNETQDFIDLVMRHWNNVNAQLDSGEVYPPLMIEDGEGAALGNDWARGFVTGTHLRHDIWADLFDDEEWGGALVPIFALAYEHHPEPECGPSRKPLTQSVAKL